MNVKLVSLTKSIGIPELTTEEDLIIYIARVSNPSNQLNTDTSAKLLRHLIKNKHWSPFDMVNMCIEVTTSKAIAIQILRHWSIKPQEFSQRYAEVTNIEPIELRQQAVKNRQSSTDIFDPIVSVPIEGDEDQSMKASELVSIHLDGCKMVYKTLLDAGIAKECARMVLPMATSTTMYLNGSIRSWIHYLEQRTDEHAQKEHREVAAEIKKIFIKHFPNTSEALWESK